MKLHILFVALAQGLLGLCCLAEDKPIQPKPMRHRITGLFSPERERDLREAVKQLSDVKLLRIDFKNAEATFEYDADKLLNRPKPEEIPQRFNDLLRPASNHTFGIEPLSTTPKNKLTLVEIPVVGLDCKACCLAAYESVYKIEGVEQATASFKEGLVTALIDQEKTNRAALETALKSRGVTLKENPKSP
ncbi:MAG: heavy metal-associated domain-containing protein [Pirellulaceae bacterium]